MTTFTTEDRIAMEKEFLMNQILEIIKDHQNEKEPPYKEYENTYIDGWLDACNSMADDFFKLLEKYTK